MYYSVYRPAYRGVYRSYTTYISKSAYYSYYRFDYYYNTNAYYEYCSPYYRSWLRKDRYYYTLYRSYTPGTYSRYNSVVYPAYHSEVYHYYYHYNNRWDYYYHEYITDPYIKYYYLLWKTRLEANYSAVYSTLHSYVRSDSYRYTYYQNAHYNYTYYRR
jgi:hypothetical protein